MSDTPVKEVWEFEVCDEFITCGAGEDAIQIAVEVWEYTVSTYLNFWSPPRSKNWSRFRWAWNCLRGNYMPMNSLVLDEKTTETLIEKLQWGLALGKEKKRK